MLEAVALKVYTSDITRLFHSLCRTKLLENFANNVSSKLAFLGQEESRVIWLFVLDKKQGYYD